VKLKGIDVSGWQHGDPGHPQINWEQVRAAGYEFVYVKCTQGLDYVNPWLTSDVQLAKEAGLLVGAYHYAVPSPATGASQAQYALAHTDHLPLDLGIALDLEELGEFTQGYETLPWAMDFLAEISKVHEDAPLYTYRAFAEAMGSLPPNHRLWLAFDKAHPPAPPPGLHPWIEQLDAEEVPGIAGLVDVDVMLSSRGVHPALPSAPALVAVPEPEKPAESEAPEPAIDRNTP